jgi:urease accessory protein
VESGLAACEASASDWLVDQLHLGLARADLPVLAKAIGAWRRGDLEHVRELNDWVRHTRESHELRAQTEQMGRSLLEWLRHHNTAGPEDIEASAQMQPTYPIAFALAASATQAGVRDALLVFAFSWAENMMSAAIKSVPLGQRAGQRILSRLADEIPAVVEQALRTKDSERQAFTPMLAILSAQHETQYSRLFRS